METAKENFEQPKFFVGKFQELVWMCQHHGWNMREVKLISNPSSTFKLMGHRLKRSDIYYGNTMDELSSEDLWRIYQELRLVIWDESEGEETPTKTCDGKEHKGI